MAEFPYERRMTGRAHARRLTLAAGISVATVVVSAGCSVRDALSFNAPAGITKQSHMFESLWFGAWVAVLAVGILTWGLIFYALFRYRRRKGDPPPKQMRYNIPLEVMYVVAPLVMILGFFSFTARDQMALTKVSDNADNNVGVIGFRWSWAFNYTDQGVYDVGTPDRTQNPTLYLPVNESVLFKLESPDVIHSFWVPAFLTKIDVFPDRLNELEVTPTKVGTYAGRCAELCGVDHSRMLFTLKVVTRAEFDAHMADLRKKGQTGAISTDRITREGERYWEKNRFTEAKQ